MTRSDRQHPLDRYLHGRAAAALAAITASLAVLMAWRIGWHLSLIGYLAFTTAGTALGLIDYETHRLPDKLTAPTLIAAAASLTADSIASGHWHPLIRAIEGAIALFAFYLANRLLGRAVLKKTTLGLGDVKLAALIGLLLTWLSWGALYIGAFAGFLTAAIAGLALIATGRGKLASRIPFGPYMLLGAVIGIVSSGATTHSPRAASTAPLQPRAVNRPQQHHGPQRMMDTCHLTQDRQAGQ